jgi:hypothetical protein
MSENPYSNKEKAKDLLLTKNCSSCGNSLKTNNGNLYCNFDRKILRDGIKEEKFVSGVLRKVSETNVYPLWMK